ncbi:WD40/YVTN/BNR-like repeat-containing protein [Polaromonas sp. CT11-55]|uniref:WD40/YVTN/BNR-like repeat-containing protein n=1 Tax=Polaromonas sp. CT11-55 TaxID=3243045 RepID=UPI0039A6757B
MAGVTRRQAALAGLLGGGAAMLPAWAASAPAVLSQAALLTPKALGAATLAVARAGDRLVAVGERGTVLLSDDHGASWRQAQVPVQASLAAVCFADARTGWAAGHLGVILRSDDAGATWHKQLDGVQAAELVKQAAQRTGDAGAVAQAQRLVEEGADKPFFDLEFMDVQRGFAVGAYNLMFATTDGGKSWTALGPRLPNSKSLHLYGVRARGRTLVVAGEQGLLLRSSDGGASFSALASPYKGSFFGLLQTRGGALVAYGLRGTAYRSGDEGQHWDKLDTGVPMAVGAGLALPDGGFVLLSQAGDALLGAENEPALKRIPAREAVPVSGAALAADGALVLASLRGMRRVQLPAN